jgi:hypothetical protein
MRRKNEGNWDKSIHYVYGVWFIRYKDKIKDVVGGVGWSGVESEKSLREKKDG